MDDVKESIPSTPDLERILLKPLTARSYCSTFSGNKKLALLHSWDEIVYRDIGRVLEYKRFKRQWTLNVSNQSRLMEHISIYKQRARSSSMHRPYAVHYQMAPLSSTKEVAVDSQSLYHHQPPPRGDAHWNSYGASMYSMAQKHRAHSVQQQFEKRRAYKVGADSLSPTVSGSNRSRSAEWDRPEVADRVLLSEDSQHSAGNMSFLSVTNEICSSVSVSSADRL